MVWYCMTIIIFPTRQSLCCYLYHVIWTISLTVETQIWKLFSNHQVVIFGLNVALLKKLLQIWSTRRFNIIFYQFPETWSTRRLEIISCCLKLPIAHFSLSPSYNYLPLSEKNWKIVTNTMAGVWLTVQRRPCQRRWWVFLAHRSITTLPKQTVHLH